MIAQTPPRARRLLPLLVGIVLGAVALSGCTLEGSSKPRETDAKTDPSEEPAAEASEEALPAGLEETDFGDLAWVFRPGGNSLETVPVELVDGKASDGAVSYELGDVVLAELTGDERMDAAAQITRLDGNAIDEQWYLWVATDDGPTQVTLPVARMARCGTVTHSVTAVESGGVKIRESRRHIGEDDLACAETGTDKRTRVVSAIETEALDGWWPVQTGPIEGFGGLCPTAAEYEGYPYDEKMHAIPDLSAEATIKGNGKRAVFRVESWPVYDGAFPGWVLVGVKQGRSMGCAWAEKS